MVLVLATLASLLATLALTAAPASAACTTALVESKLACQFGSEGEGAGEFHPEAIAVDDSSELSLDPSAGDVYIADRANNRVDKFSADGEFLLAWGWGVLDGHEEAEVCGPKAPVPSGCEVGREGGGAGQLHEPSGVAVDGDAGSAADGDVFVEDTRNHRVDKFGPDGEFLLAWGEGVADGKAEPQTCGPEAVVHTCRAAFEPKVAGTGEGPGEFERLAPRAIAVDSAGRVYVGDVGRVQEFSANGAFARQVTLTGLGFVEALAVNKAGDIFVMSGFGVREYEACASSCVGKELGKPREPSAEGEESSIALGSFGELFVESRGRVSELEGAGEAQLASFPSAAPQRGLAFGDRVGELYVLTPREVQVLPLPPPGPLVESEGQEATLEPAGTATLHASIDPEGKATKYHVLYGVQGAGVSETETEMASTTATEFEPEPVEVKLKGLQAGTTYGYHLVATNASGTNAGEALTFTTLPAVAIESEWVSQVTATSARLAAEVNPQGTSTEYRFEYLTDAEFVANGDSFSGSDEPVLVPSPPDKGNAAAGVAAVPVGVLVEGLEATTTYHYRLVAKNALGEAVGGDRTFTTQGAGGESRSGLIDGRAWELVSPPDKHGASLEMSTEEGGLVQAAENGDGLAYFAEAPIGTNTEGSRSFSYTQLLATREGIAGWGTQDLDTPHEEVLGLRELSEYKLLSSDLSTGLVEPEGATRLSKAATERTPYVRDDPSGEYEPLLPAAGLAPETRFGGEQPGPGNAFVKGAEFVSATPDLGHVVISSPVALAGGFESHGLASLFEWSAGALQPVSVLPDGMQAAQAGLTASLGAAGRGVRDAISSDGSRVIFEAGDERESDLYLRDLTLQRTVQLDVPEAGVSEPGPREAGYPLYLDAAGDGGRVFFADVRSLTKGASATTEHPDLYMCEVAAISPAEQDCSRHLTDLTVPLHSGEQGNLRGLIGVGQEGNAVYFVATGALTPEATPGEDLYVRDTTTGQTRLIAQLSGADSLDWQAGPFGYNDGELTARVSPDGRWLAFMSQEPLTGYDNHDVSSGRPDEEVFLYHAPEGLAAESGSHPSSLTCVSCNPTGGRPHGVFDPLSVEPPFPSPLLADRPDVWANHWLAASLPAWNRVNTEHALYQPRYLSDSGRVFFDSPDALVPADTNGKEDVYEYEPAGVPSGEHACSPASTSGSEVFKPAHAFEVQLEGGKVGGEEGAGCVGLISSGTSSEESAFMDASENGDDVFFMTSAKLVGQDIDSARDVYDAHVCSTEQPCPTPTVTVPPACDTTDSCRAAPGGRGSESDHSNSSVRVREHRARLRKQGLRPIQIWVPDVRAPRFAEEAHLQSRAVAASRTAVDDQAFVDSISAWPGE